MIVCHFTVVSCGARLSTHGNSIDLGVVNCVACLELVAQDWVDSESRLARSIRKRLADLKAGLAKLEGSD